jgi:hypothetical protein
MATSPRALQVPISPAKAIYGAAPPVAVCDTTERVERFVGKRAFGFGADLLAYLGRREAKAMRLVSRLLHDAVDRRAWPVRSSVCVCVCVCECMCVYVCVCVCVSVHFV